MCCGLGRIHVGHYFIPSDPVMHGLCVTKVVDGDGDDLARGENHPVIWPRKWVRWVDEESTKQGKDKEKREDQGRLRGPISTLGLSNRSPE